MVDDIATRILALGASPIPRGNTISFVERALELAGVSEAEVLNVARMEIKDCLHCNFCARRQTPERICNIEDEMTAVYQKALRADVILFASPVYFGRLSGNLAKVIDRLRALGHGKVYYRALDKKIGAAISITWFRNGGAEIALLTEVMAILALGMIPASLPGESALGAVGVSSLAGSGQFDPQDRLLSLQDSYGLSVASRVIQRAVSLSEIIRIGQQALKASDAGTTP